MAKKLIFLLGVILAAEIVAVGFGLNAFRPYSRAAKADSALYSNPYSETALNGSASPELKFKGIDKTWTPTKAELAPWVKASERTAQASSSFANYFYSQTKTAHPWSDYSFSDKVKGRDIDEEIVGKYLLSIASEQNRPPQDAVLEIRDGRAVAFAPHLTGALVDLVALKQNSSMALVGGQKELDLPLHESKPQIRLGELNNLGIRERLARGQSDFTGSSASRIHNITVGASRYQGILIAPGKEFSFNEYLGPVDGKHGFLPELVIKPEGTIPEFGGGLCQVSSTAFRAAFFSGLPITARRNHSYAVKYYEWISDDAPRAVGLDATIYPGSQDMKFINDTPGTILIWTKMEGKRLYFDFYGTSDGREVATDGPHPYDRRAGGAVKSKVTRKVIKNGEVIEVTFNSNYVSPALYPRVYEYAPPPPTVPENPLPPESPPPPVL